MGPQGPPTSMVEETSRCPSPTSAGASAPEHSPAISGEPRQSGRQSRQYATRAAELYSNLQHAPRLGEAEGQQKVPH